MRFYWRKLIFPLHWELSSLSLCRPSACCEGLCEFMCASILLCLEDVVSLGQPSPLALKMFLFPLLQTCWAPRAEVIHCVLFSLESLLVVSIYCKKTLLWRWLSETQTPFICGWTLGLPPSLICCVQCCYGQGWAVLPCRLDPASSSSRCVHRSRDILIDLALPFTTPSSSLISRLTFIKDLYSDHQLILTGHGPAGDWRKATG